ncbi:MAG: sugar transferase, partial [Shewanella sp.]
MNDSVVYIYCLEQDKERINKAIKNYPVNICFNHFDFDNYKNKTLLHYKSGLLDERITELLIHATKKGAHVEPLVSYLDARFGHTEVELLHSGYFLHMKAFSILSRRSNRVIKRILDLFFVALLSVIAIPVGIITAVAIKKESPGPVFYRQKRVGQY